MAQSVEELIELGLSEAEAKRVVNRKAKAEEKRAQDAERAEKRLPKAQAQLDYAADRAEHWTRVAKEAQAKVDKYIGVIEGTAVEAPEVEPEPEPEPEAPAKSTRKRK